MQNKKLSGVSLSPKALLCHFEDLGYKLDPKLIKTFSHQLNKITWLYNTNAAQQDDSEDYVFEPTNKDLKLAANTLKKHCRIAKEFKTDLEDWSSACHMVSNYFESFFLIQELDNFVSVLSKIVISFKPLQTNSKARRYKVLEKLMDAVDHFYIENVFPNKNYWQTKTGYLHDKTALVKKVMEAANIRSPSGANKSWAYDVRSQKKGRLDKEVKKHTKKNNLVMKFLNY